MYMGLMMRYIDYAKISIFILKDKSYSEIINIIGIIPIIAPKELLENGKYKEVKHCSVAYGFADVNLFMDYEKIC